MVALIIRANIYSNVTLVPTLLCKDMCPGLKKLTCEILASYARMGFSITGGGVCCLTEVDVGPLVVTLTLKLKSLSIEVIRIKTY